MSTRRWGSFWSPPREDLGLKGREARQVRSSKGATHSVPPPSSPPQVWGRAVLPAVYTGPRELVRQDAEREEGRHLPRDQVCLWVDVKGRQPLNDLQDVHGLRHPRVKEAHVPVDAAERVLW